MCQSLTGWLAERSCREGGSGGKLLRFHLGSVMWVLHTLCNFCFLWFQGEVWAAFKAFVVTESVWMRWFNFESQRFKSNKKCKTISKACSLKEKSGICKHKYYLVNFKGLKLCLTITPAQHSGSTRLYSAMAQGRTEHQHIFTTDNAQNVITSVR